MRFHLLTAAGLCSAVFAFFPSAASAAEDDIEAELIAIRDAGWPDDAAQAAALATVKDVFKDEYKAMKSEQVSALAKKLLGNAATESAPAMKCVLLVESANLAAKAVDAPTLLDALAKLSESFPKADEPAAIKFKLLADTAKKASKPEDLKALAQALADTAESLAADDKLKDADTALAQADAAAKKAKDPGLAANIKMASDAVKAQAAEAAKVKTAMATLSTTPDDPAANLAVGRYKCFVKGEWSDGLAMLAKSSDEAMKSAAAAERAAGDDSAQLLKAADAWWDLSEKTKEKKINIHAGVLYEKVLPSLKGMDKSKAEKRIDAAAMLGIGVSPGAKEKWISKDAKCMLSSERPGGLNPEFLSCEKTSGFFLHTGLGGEQWCMVELKKPFAISKIEVKNRTDGAKDRIVGAQLLLSTDGKNWTKVDTFKDCKDDYSFKIKIKIAKYIKILQTTGAPINLCNMKVYGY